MAKANDGLIDEELIRRAMIAAFASSTLAMKVGQASGVADSDVADALEQGFKDAARELADQLRRGLTRAEAREEMRVAFEAKRAERPEFDRAAAAVEKMLDEVTDRGREARGLPKRGGLN